MSKSKINKVQFKKSSELNEDRNGPKLPKPHQLDYGEMAVNYAKDNEALSIKNSENEIVAFKSYKELRLISRSGNVIITMPYARISDANANSGYGYGSGYGYLYEGIGKWDDLPEELEEDEEKARSLDSEDEDDETEDKSEQTTDDDSTENSEEKSDKETEEETDGENNEDLNKLTNNE